MIGLSRRRTKTAVSPSFRAPRLQQKSEALVDLFYAAQQAGAKIAFDSSAWKPAKRQLKEEAFGKCAYCEASTETVAHGDVEHFRPKSKYWWLAFCYDNYLYSCQICNQIHKGDRFPVRGATLEEPPMPPVKPKGAERLALINSLTIDALAHSDGTILSLWAAEDADLVNPYHEDPTPLFAYEADPINEEVWLRAEPAARAARALAAAEEVLGINREPLRRVRYSQYAALVLAKTAWSSTDDELHALATTMLKRLQHPSQPFAGMSRWYARAWGLSLA